MPLQFLKLSVWKLPVFSIFRCVPNYAGCSRVFAVVPCVLLHSFCFRDYSGVGDDSAYQARRDAVVKPVSIVTLVALIDLSMDPCLAPLVRVNMLMHAYVAP